MSSLKYIFIIIILFTPQVNGLEIDTNGLSTSDWFLTTDFQNMTFDGNFNYVIKGSTRNILFREINNQDFAINGLEYQKLEKQLFDQETGFSLGKNETLEITGVLDGYYFEDNPLDNPLYVGDTFSNSKYLLSNFDPNLNRSQIAELSYSHTQIYPFTDTPVDNGSYFLGSYRGWNNISATRNYNYHMLFNGSSILNINGYNLEVYTYTILPEIYPFSGNAYSEGYCYDSIDCMSYSGTTINETGSFSWAKWYNFGNLTRETLDIQNSTTSWSQQYNYYDNGTLMNAVIDSYPITNLLGHKMIVRYSPELNYVVQAFGWVTNTLYRNPYEVREFNVKSYVPQSSGSASTITQNITIIETNTEYQTEYSTTSVTIDTNPPTTAPYYFYILIPTFMVIVIVKKQFDNN